MEIRYENDALGTVIIERSAPGAHSNLVPRLLSRCGRGHADAARLRFHVDRALRFAGPVSIPLRSPVVKIAPVYTSTART